MTLKVCEKCGRYFVVGEPCAFCAAEAKGEIHPQTLVVKPQRFVASKPRTAESEWDEEVLGKEEDWTQ